MKKQALNNLTAVRHNYLNEASYSMTLNEKRLVYAALGQIDSKSKAVPDQIKIHAEDFSELWGIGIDTAYRTLKTARENLKKREIRTINLDNNEVWDINWIESSAYQDGEGYVILCFSQKIKPYLVDLHRNFTAVSLLDVKNLSSEQSIRFFEFMMQYMVKDPKKETFGSGWMGYEVEDLKCKLDLEKKYEKWADFKRYVIDKIIEEIERKTKFNLWMPEDEIKKKGRTVHYIVFRFMLKNSKPGRPYIDH